MPLHVGDHQPGAALVGGGEDPVRLREGDRHRLLHEDVLSRTQEIGRDLPLAIEGRRDGYGVDLGILCELQVG